MNPSPLTLRARLDRLEKQAAPIAALVVVTDAADAAEALAERERSGIGSPALMILTGVPRRPR